jgi:restriction endonuclease S subunit
MLRTPASRENIKKNAKTVTMTTIDQDGLLRTKIFLPPMHLQNKFNSIFTSIVKQKTVLAKGMRNDAALASSLQHQAFTTGFRA